VAVSLRLLYLIFQHLLGLLLLMGRTSRSEAIELLVLVVERLPDASPPDAGPFRDDNQARPDHGCLTPR